MKILHISLYGPVTDGWNYQDNMLPKYQVKNGNTVYMITSKWIYNSNGQIVYYDKTNYVYDGIIMYRLDLKFGVNIHSKVKVYSGLYKLIETIKPECIFVHNIAFIDIKRIVQYAKNYEVIIYADNHNDFSNSAQNWISKNIFHKRIWKHYAKMIEPYVTKFYGTSPARVDFLIDIYGLSPQKCELLVMGADDELVTQVVKNNSGTLIREKYNIKENDILIVTGGKIDSFKIQTLLLMEAVRNINNERVKLIVFGSVDSKLKRKVLELCDSRVVQYVGWIKAEESYQYFEAADLVVFPGRHSVFWEQVAGQGKPLVCKYWKGTTHIDVGGNVVFLYEDSAEEIGMVINDIIGNVEKFNNMKEIAEMSKEKFSYNMISKKAIGY